MVYLKYVYSKCLTIDEQNPPTLVDRSDRNSFIHVISFVIIIDWLVILCNHRFM